MNEKIRIASTDALIVIDVQNDFCSGSLAIPDADAIVPVINRLGMRFSHVVITQDWHPEQHVSFASSHPGKLPGDTAKTAYGPQSLFADHCVQAGWGAELHPGLEHAHAGLILRKGCRREIDSFSAFVENDRATETGLAAYLRARGIRRVFLAGLALYGCVRCSAIDARAAGFEVMLIDDACRGRTNVSDAEYARSLIDAGVERILECRFAT